MKTGTAITLLTILTLCSIVPFAARAVYLDEHIYLHVAEMVWAKDWRFPQDTPWIIFGIPMVNLSIHSHPPLGEYFLALMLKLFGHFQEVPFRLLWGVFPIMAVLSFYRLARRFTTNPLIVSSLFAVSPAFFLMSPTLMMDIPMLALFLLGLGLYLDSIDGKRHRLWLAPICFVLSAGTGYTMLVPLGCLFLWAAAKKRPLRELASILAVPFVLFLWLMLMRSHFGVIPIAETIKHFSVASAFTSNFPALFSFLGGVSLLPWAFLACIDLLKKWILVAAGFFIATGLSFLQPLPSLSYRLWYIVLASCGIALLITFIAKCIDGESSPRATAKGFLILWLPSVLLFFLVTADMVNARYLLLALPPLFLILFANVHRMRAVFTIAATLILSAALAIGDYRYVNSYRDWAAKHIAPLQEQGFRIWCASESGLRFYLKQKGIDILSMYDLRPRGGDLIVRQSSFRYGLSSELEPLLLSIFKEDIRDSYFLRTFVRDSGAGFHDSHFGIVPFSFSKGPLDQIEIMEVSPFVTHLPQVVPPDFSTVPVWFPGGVLLKQVQPEMRFKVRRPRGATVAYTLEGKGSLEVSDEEITLRKMDEGPVVWKNFRFVPSGF
jgi:4-amino-4-deoxy-L-arabinose transferase-like glycosyltransferase